jgi:hypothetical protein
MQLHNECMGGPRWYPPQYRELVDREGVEPSVTRSTADDPVT